MTWAELFERAAAYAVDEASIRAALAERRGDDGGPGAPADDGREQPPDGDREADGP